MDIPLSYQNSENCTKHNQPIIIYSTDPKVGGCCPICLQQQPGFVSVESFNKQLEEMQSQYYEDINMNQLIYQQISEYIVSYRKSIVNSLDKILHFVTDQIKIMSDSKQNFNNLMMSNQNQQQKIKQLQKTIEDESQNDKYIKNQIRQQLTDLVNKSQNVGQLLSLLSKPFSKQNQIQGDAIQIQKELMQEVKQKDAKKLLKFQYELIKESTLKEINYCQAFAFNKDNSVLVVGLQKDIVIYEFKKGRISKELQKLNNHTDDIYCLYFMKQSNSFVSGSRDKTIIIWILDQNNKWVAEWVLKELNGHINCVLMNKMEDQLISGCQNSEIKFFRKQNGIWESYQAIETKFYVKNMSLNECEDKLIVLENNYEFGKPSNQSCIHVLMQKNDQEWNQVQTLYFSEHGWRVCFTLREQFLFSTQNSNLIDVYDFDASNQEFKKLKSFQIQYYSQCYALFPCQFIRSLNILSFKNGQFINIFKINEKNDYELIQSIELKNPVLRGSLSDDGQYIVTWCNTSKEIQVRKIKYEN